MKLHLIVVSIFFLMCVKDHGDSSSQLLGKNDLISMYRGALVSSFVIISVYFNKIANNF